MKTINGICLYGDEIILKEINLVKDGHQLEPDVQCKICSSIGRTSIQPWSHKLSTDSFILHHPLHRETCTDRINNFSEIIHAKCDWKYEEIDNEINKKQQGELWFLKSIPREKLANLKFDFTKPQSQQDLLDKCIYVDCDENDLLTIKKIIQSHMKKPNKRNKSHVSSSYSLKNFSEWVKTIKLI